MKYSVNSLHFSGKILAEILPDLFSVTEGIPVFFEKSTLNQTVVSENEVRIFYTALANAWCALGDLICGDTPSDIVPIPNRGVMLDASRNAVPTIPYLKKLLTQLALCGLNQFCLYTEDTYSVPGEPLIGYGRGRYTEAELRELDDYAETLGVELFPCIQTLGHFEQILRYNVYSGLRDSPRILNTRLEETYAFIEKLILAASAPFRSKRIHIGLDEPFGLGRGNAFDFNSPRSAGEVFAAHLRKVTEICRSHGLSPMLWGDYVLGHSGEKALTPEETEAMPRDAQMVYWDYDTENPESYRKNIQSFRQLGYEPVCAPSAHSYNRFFPNFAKMEKTCGVFTDVMHEEKIQSSLLTLWGDDGHECLSVYALPSILYYLSCVRGFKNQPEHFQKRMTCISGISEHQLRVLSRIADPDIPVKDNPELLISGKMLLWDDPLHRFVMRFVGNEVAARFEEARWSRAEDKLKNPLFAFPESYCSLICSKVTLVHNITESYRRNDRSTASAYAVTIPELIQHIESFHARYRELWLAERKPFGLEIIDHRVGGFCLRVREWKKSVLAWCRGEVDTIPELEDDSAPLMLRQSDLAFHNRIFSRCFQLWT